MTLDYFYGQAGELFSFYRIPKALFQEQRFQSLSTDAKTLYGILLDRMSLSVKNGWLDKQGRVFIIFTIGCVVKGISQITRTTLLHVSVPTISERRVFPKYCIKRENQRWSRTAAEIQSDEAVEG